MDKRYLLGTIYQTAPFLIWSMLFLSSCASVPMPNKEWTDAYDSEQWRNQYEACKTKLFTEYPTEVDSTEWSECMGEFNKDE
jgi:hypothetical protein